MAKWGFAKKVAVVACALALCAGALVACGGGSSSGSVSGAASASSSSLKDGTYTGTSATHEDGVEGDGYGVVNITLKDGKITDVQFQAFEVDGTPKDENYGKDGAYYAVAQKAISAGEQYAKDLVEAGHIDGVDVVSGATLLYDQFVEAVEDAMAQAAK